MILLTTLIKIAFSCITKINDLHLYPTIYENYSLPMDVLFENNLGLKYFCWNCFENSTAKTSINNTIETISN